MLPLLTNTLIEAIPGIQESVGHFLPEIVLSVFACVVLLFDLSLRDDEASSNLAWPAVGGLILALLMTFDSTFFASDYAADVKKTLFSGAIVVDRFSGFFKFIFLFGSLLTVVLAYHSRELYGKRMGEFYSLLFCSAVGMCLMASSVNFLMLFIAIELVSIPSYVLVGYVFRDRRGSEASLKYVLYGAFSGGVMLFGVSLIYGLTGSTNYHEIARALSEANNDKLLLFAIAGLMTFGGFAYKMAAAPFHFWAPDVYQGAPTPVTAWLSVTSKAAGIAAFMRFLYAFQGTDYAFGALDWKLVIIVLSALTMTIGNVSALLQDNVKRMLAYSSVAHVGYILMGLAALGGQDQGDHILVGNSGGSAAVFYTFSYMWMNLGAFAVVLAIHNRYGSEDFSRFVGLGERAPAMAVAMTIYMFAFIGLPPTVGFTAKMQLFMAVINGGGWGTVLAVIAGVNTAISAYYYMRLVKTMWLENYGDPAHKEPLTVAQGLYLICVLMAVPVLAFGVVGPFIDKLSTVSQQLSVVLGGS